jgi:non-ribosomal peptide synthase protein (TIGR01720 family)
VPRKGIGYGLLLEEDKVRALPKAEVAFRHLGGEWELGAEPGPLASATLLPGEAGGSRLPNGRLLELESFVIGGQLHVRFRYDGGTLGASGIERLSAGLQEALRALSAEGQDTRAALTSVDFPLAGLDDSQLGALAAMIEQADGSDE